MKIHVINVTHCTFHILKFSLDLIPFLWPMFINFQNEATGLCVNNSDNEAEK